MNLSLRHLRVSRLLSPESRSVPKAVHPTGSALGHYQIKLTVKNYLHKISLYNLRHLPGSDLLSFFLSDDLHITG